MYAKLFASIYQGTLRGNTHGLLVFTNMLAHADKDGWVDMHPRVIAEEVGLTVEDVQSAINELEAPDPDSRSPEEDGRRIVRMDEHRSWGWFIVNHAKYRAIRNEEDRREQNRLSQERWRKKNKPSVSKVSQASAESANTETETETEKSKALSASADVVTKKLNGSEATARELLEFLNAKTGRNYRPVFANLEPIVARLKEGFTVQDVKTVIARKCRDWMHDDKMALYLRPATLFNRTKFAQYNGECVEVKND